MEWTEVGYHFGLISFIFFNPVNHMTFLGKYPYSYRVVNTNKGKVYIYSSKNFFDKRLFEIEN